MKQTIWKQFGASIDMLENAIFHCPKNIWESHQDYWYISYHTLFWLDYYLTLQPDQFLPPAPFDLSEFDSSGAKPNRRYTQKGLLSYLSHCRDKCFDLLSDLTEVAANARWINETKNYTVLEILLYNMRHVQHHAAQLNMLLRQEIDDAPKWVSVAEREME